MKTDPTVLANHKRIMQAMETLSEHFHGVLILAHEVLPGGMTQRYSALRGDPLACRYHARWWVDLEESVERLKVMTIIAEQSDKRKKDDEDDQSLETT